MKDARRIGSRLRFDSWRGISFLLPLVLLLVLQHAAKAQDQFAVDAAINEGDSKPPLDLVFCIEATSRSPNDIVPPVESPKIIIANIARRIIAQYPERHVRIGVVPYCVPYIPNNPEAAADEAVSADPDLKLELTEDATRFLAVLNGWHQTRYRFSKAPVDTMEKEVMGLSWSNDSRAIRKLYIIGNEHLRVKDTYEYTHTMIVHPGMSYQGFADQCSIGDMWMTLQQTGDTIPNSPRLDMKTTMFTDFVNHFVGGSPGRRASVSMMLCGSQVNFNRGQVDVYENNVRTIGHWLEMGWPFREGWIEDAERGGGEYIQYIIPGLGPMINGASQHAVLWSRPSTYRDTCRRFLQLSPVLKAEAVAQRAAGKAKLAKLPDLGLPVKTDADSTLPVLTFFADYPDANAIPIH